MLHPAGGRSRADRACAPLAADPSAASTRLPEAPPRLPHLDHFAVVGPLGRANGRSRIISLVPRTRSSHDIAASAVANFGFESGTRIIELLVSLDSEVRIRGCGEVLRTSESGH